MQIPQISCTFCIISSIAIIEAASDCPLNGPDWPLSNQAICTYYYAKRSFRWEPYSFFDLSVITSVRIFDDFYEEDMEVVRMLVPTGTLTKKFRHEIRGPKKSMQKLGLAVDTGIGRDPFSDPVLSHFLHFF